MKLDGVIIKNTKTNTFTGFVKQYPGVCAQSKSIGDLKSKLDDYMSLYSAYANKVVMDVDDIFTV